MNTFCLKENRSFLIGFVIFMFALLTACHKRGGGYNPYLSMKRNPAEQLQHENKRINKRTERAYKRQMGRSRKQLFGSRKPPKED